MLATYQTDRLTLQSLSIDDAAFLLELVNTPEWLKFIGDRNIHSIADAAAYIEKVCANPNLHYWIVKLTDENATRIGTVTFIKRDYLEHHDIGFAFLPRYAKQGFAYEAASAVLHDAVCTEGHSKILATTIAQNTNSIALLKKLGLSFERELTLGNDQLLIFSECNDKLFIDDITKRFFNAFSNIALKEPDLETVRTICLPQTIVIKKTAEGEEVMNLDAFISPRKKMLTDGSLMEFSEKEISGSTLVAGNIAQRVSTYEKGGLLHGARFEGRGTKMFQYVRTREGWKITAILWEDVATAETSDFLK